MANANPRIHVICGICGCKDEMSFNINEWMRDENDDPILDCHGKYIPEVWVSCHNCASLTSLAELMPYKDK